MNEHGQGFIAGFVGAHHQKQRERDQNGGQQEVGGHTDRVQPGQDGNATENGLSERIGGMAASLASMGLFFAPLMLRWMQTRSLRTAVRLQWLERPTGR